MPSVAIMAHPKREHFVKQLRRRLRNAPVIWDQKNDRWDTGRRAVLAFDPNEKWHLIVQDDAILCKNFLRGVERALDAVPDGYPVSFYTGKTRPYAQDIKRAVHAAQMAGQRWLALRGPLWGVAVALPTSSIQQMIAECDDLKIPNYDMRMAEWFNARDIACWYSIPSLVDHRTGPENPSLVPERGASPARTAHAFLGKEDPLRIDWRTDAHWVSDPSEPWRDDYSCTRCSHQSASLVAAVVHASREHRAGRVDMLASTQHHARMLVELREALPPDVCGEFWFLDDGRHRFKLSIAHTRVRRAYAKRKIPSEGSLIITGALRDLKHLPKGRPAWSLDGFAN